MSVSQFISSPTWRSPLVSLLMAFSICGAQEHPAEADAERGSFDQGPLEEVVATATKKGEAEVAQYVPAAISVLTSDSLAERHVTDIEDLSYALPNVALDAVGSTATISGFVGYTDGAYDEVRHDLNGDGSTVGDDRFKLPRLAPTRQRHRHRFPQDIIRHAVWLYYRFCLSYRDAEDLLAERGI